jgi:hypothetical protein
VVALFPDGSEEQLGVVDTVTFDHPGAPTPNSGKPPVQTAPSAAAGVPGSGTGAPLPASLPAFGGILPGRAGDQGVGAAARTGNTVGPPPGPLVGTFLDILG